MRPQQPGGGYYQMQYPVQLPPPTHFSIDVECIATGPTHLDRAVAQISLVVSPRSAARRRAPRPGRRSPAQAEP